MMRKKMNQLPKKDKSVKVVKFTKAMQSQLIWRAFKDLLDECVDKKGKVVTPNPMGVQKAVEIFNKFAGPNPDFHK